MTTALSTTPSPREIAERVNSLIRGKSNNVTTVTLTAGGTSTTLTDARIGVNSFIGLTPTTANAATATANVRVSAKTNGSATLTHSNTADVDKTFDVVIIG